MEYKLTRWDELRLWWEFKGELTADVITYYAICCAWGYIQGVLMGQQILRML